MKQSKAMQSMKAPADDPRQREFYTIPEAARLLQVSQATVWRWIQADKLPAYRVGPRRIRIKREELETVIRPARQKEMSMDKESQRPELWAGYDPQRARQAIEASAGTLVGVDRHQLMADLRAQREQASYGRPA